MPQEKSDKTEKVITTKNVETLKDKDGNMLVRPFDKVGIKWTKAAEAAGNTADKMELVHPLLAKKLVAKKFATEVTEAETIKLKEAVKDTEDQILRKSEM